MTLDVPLSVKVDQWRKEILERPMTIEEMREILRVLREGRIGAAATSAKARAVKAGKGPVDLAGLEDELDNL